MNKNIMRATGFSKEVEKIKHGLCPMCSKPIKMKEFKDDLSRKEYGISGMCQVCQDGIFDNG